MENNQLPKRYHVYDEYGHDCGIPTEEESRHNFRLGCGCLIIFLIEMALLIWKCLTETKIPGN